MGKSVARIIEICAVGVVLALLVLFAGSHFDDPEVLSTWQCVGIATGVVAVLTAGLVRLGTRRHRHRHRH